MLADREWIVGEHIEDSEIRDRGSQGHDQETSTEADGVGAVDLILVFGRSLGRIGAGDDHGDEIEEDQAGEDYLAWDCAGSWRQRRLFH